MSSMSCVIDVMREVEKEDELVRVLLIHPDDLEVLSSNTNYEPNSTSPRPEWGGDLVGKIFNALVICTPQVDPGFPDAIPAPRGVQHILAALTDARVKTYNPQSVPRPNPLLKASFKVRSQVIRWLGGRPPFDSYTRVGSKG